MKFDPFEDRPSRDVRNHLSNCLIKSIKNKNISSFDQEASTYLSTETPDHIKVYVTHRRQGLKQILAQMEILKVDSRDLFRIAMMLWNIEMFFEFHEWLEEKWLTASGDNKKALQGLILTAVVYEQLTYGRTGPAKKTALRAVSLLNRHAHLFSDQLDTDVLIPALINLDPVSPKFDLSDFQA